MSTMSRSIDAGPAPEDAEPPSIPLRFVIGQDREGHWIVRATHGRAGGLFVSREAALDYAEFESSYRPGAVRLAAQPMELEI
jgi:hypothetical protein